MSTKLAVALVLCDVPAHGLKAGALVEADPALIKALVADGSCDTHRECVAIARTNGAATMRSAIELAAEAKAAEADTLRVEIAKLEDLLAKAEDEPTKGALAGQIVEQRAALAALG